jgi:MFS family permease
MLQAALLMLSLGNLLCGFAQTPVQLYIFRAISGMGGGGVNGIAMVIVSARPCSIWIILTTQVSDIVSMQDRGKYQGFISAATSFGSAVVGIHDSQWCY